MNLPLASADGAAVPATSPLLWVRLLFFASAPSTSADRRRLRGAGHDARCLATTEGERSLSSVTSSIGCQPSMDGCVARIYGSYAIMFEVHGTTLRCVMPCPHDVLVRIASGWLPAIWVVHYVMLCYVTSNGPYSLEPSTGLCAHQ